jgi:hypothetical protein
MELRVVKPLNWERTLDWDFNQAISLRCDITKRSDRQQFTVERYVWQMELNLLEWSFTSKLDRFHPRHSFSQFLFRQISQGEVLILIHCQCMCFNFESFPSLFVIVLIHCEWDEVFLSTMKQRGELKTRFIRQTIGVVNDWLIYFREEFLNNLPNKSNEISTRIWLPRWFCPICRRRVIRIGSLKIE